MLPYSTSYPFSTSFTSNILKVLPWRAVWNSVYVNMRQFFSHPTPQFWTLCIETEQYKHFELSLPVFTTHLPFVKDGSPSTNSTFPLDCFHRLFRQHGFGFVKGNHVG